MSNDYNVDRDRPILDFWWHSYCTIISSTDNPFAISDTFRKYLPETKESLLIVAPYVSKSFIDMIRTLLKGITIKFLTRIPNEKSYWASRAIESLTQIANSSGLKLDIRCKPNLHAKFIVVDNEIVLSGSVNPTSSGMYDNDEIIYVFQNPTDVKRHMDVFNKLWNCPKNTGWKNVQLYFGHRSYDDSYETHRAIAKVVIGHFQMNGTKPVRKDILCEQIARRGFDKDDVIETVKVLLNDGILFEPKPDWLKLTDYQTNIHDF